MLTMKADKSRNLHSGNWRSREVDHVIWRSRNHEHQGQLKVSAGSTTKQRGWLFPPPCYSPQALGWWDCWTGQCVSLSLLTQTRGSSGRILTECPEMVGKIWASQEPIKLVLHTNMTVFLAVSRRKDSCWHFICAILLVQRATSLHLFLGFINNSF